MCTQCELHLMRGQQLSYQYKDISMVSSKYVYLLQALVEKFKLLREGTFDLHILYSNNFKVRYEKSLAPNLSDAVPLLVLKLQSIALYSDARILREWNKPILMSTNIVCREKSAAF